MRISSVILNKVHCASFILVIVLPVIYNYVISNKANNSKSNIIVFYRVIGWL
jgi:hypothetical protein